METSEEKWWQIFEAIDNVMSYHYTNGFRNNLFRLFKRFNAYASKEVLFMLHVRKMLSRQVDPKIYFRVFLLLY